MLRTLMMFLSTVVIQLVFLKHRPFLKLKLVRRSEPKNPIAGRELLRKLKWDMLVTRESRTFLLGREDLEQILNYVHRSSNIRI